MEKLTEFLNHERGRRLALAKALNIYPSAISQWQRVPIDRVLMIEAATGIPREDLRPDVFKPNAEVAA
jgi:DNA-binding transcriptional regulator YdaS (Cro superfamily)